MAEQFVPWKLPWTAMQVQNAIGKGPIIGHNGNWWTWDMETSLYRDTGVAAGTVRPSNPNLLDNWYFPDPINQRNIASGETWPANSKTLDRWNTSYGAANKWVSGEGIYISNLGNSIIEYRIESGLLPAGTQVTWSALIDGKAWSSTFLWGTSADKHVGDDGIIIMDYLTYYPGNGVYTLRLWNTGPNIIKVTAVKLELGSEQTLAHLEGNTWVLNDPPPNKALELAKCQRYMQVIKNASASGSSGLALGISNGPTVYVSLPLSVPLRARPTLTYSPTGITAYRGVAGEHPAVTNLTVYGVFPNCVYLAATTEKQFDAKDAVYLEIGAGAYIILDASLE